MAKEIDITKDLYLCSPLLNKECSKTNCYINNGCCRHTVDKENGKYYQLQDDYEKQSFYTYLSKEERKQYEYEDYLIEQLQQKENVIKEGREYIENYMPNYDFDKTNLKKLLGILDKGGIK